MSCIAQYHCGLSIVLYLMSVLMTPQAACSQVFERYEMNELTFSSACSYQSEQKDVVLECTFYGPSGQTETVMGFWDGGRTYRVRFSPWETGHWTWTTKCNDTLNTGLHHRTGSFDAVPSSRQHEFAIHGWPGIPNAGRTMTLADGTPWFYLADLTWEITCGSTFEQVRQYVSRLKSCGFNALQMCSLSHLQIGYHGVAARNGDSFIDRDAYRPNPRYYAYLDSIVQCLNDSGLVAVIAPLWGYFTVVHGLPNTARLLDHDEAMELARYTAARYAGYNVMWIAAGDESYKTTEQQNFWSDFGRMLHRAGGRRHMTTIHTHGWSASFQFFDSTADWLDFHMFQSGHATDTEAPWTLPKLGWEQVPHKPLVNGEPCFEDLFTEPWAEDTTAAGCIRLLPEHVRNACWQSILSGSIMGTAHGVNGVWQWHTESDPGRSWVRYPLEQAWHMSSYDDMYTLKRILACYAWQRLVPHPELIVETPRGIQHISIASTDSVLMAYLPKHTPYVRILPDGLGRVITGTWIDPVDGISCKLGTIQIDSTGTTICVSPPDTNDWILVLRNADNAAIDSINAIPEFVLTDIGLLSSQLLSFQFDCTSSGIAEVDIYDVLGRHIAHQSRFVRRGRNTLNLQVHNVGLHLYRITFTSQDGAAYSKTGKVLN